MPCYIFSESSFNCLSKNVYIKVSTRERSVCYTHIEKPFSKNISKMEKPNYRSYIQMRFELGFNAATIHNELKEVHGDQAPSYPTVWRWYDYFKHGGNSLEDTPRPGRPITACTTDNISRVREVIEDNPYCSYDDIEAQTLLSRGTVERIIHEHLKLRKITSRFVPHNLTEENRRNRVRLCEENLAKFRDSSWRLCDVITGDASWFYWRQIGHKQSNKSWVGEGEKPRTIARVGRFEPKTMVCIFFRTSGVDMITYWDRGTTIDNVS